VSVSSGSQPANSAWSPRNEPLLWLQFLGVAVLPLEALLLLMVLASEGPARLPALEHLLTWSIGALLPATLFWQMPPGPFSLLLVQVPGKALNPQQRQLLTPPVHPLPLRLLAVSGVVPLLALLSKLDRMAPQAMSWSPLRESPRLVGLVLAAGLLALMLWQWQQGIQSIWLLLRPAGEPSSEAGETEPSGTKPHHGVGERLTLGIPLLLVSPLDWSAPPPSPAAGSPTEGSPSGATIQPAAESEAKTEREPISDDAPAALGPGSDGRQIELTPAVVSGREINAGAGSGSSVPPEQADEEEENDELDQQDLSTGDPLAAEEPGEHDQEADSAGSGDGDPEPPAQSPPGGA